MAQDFHADLARLGRFIRQRRTSLGLTQAQLGAALGWAQERVSLLENGKYGLPSLPHLMRLADALAAPLSEVLQEGGVASESELATMDAAIRTARIQQLSRRVVELVNQMGQVENRVHDAERTLVEAERVRTRLRKQRRQMQHSVSMISSAVDGAGRFPPT